MVVSCLYVEFKILILKYSIWSTSLICESTSKEFSCWTRRADVILRIISIQMKICFVKIFTNTKFIVNSDNCTSNIRVLNNKLIVEHILSIGGSAVQSHSLFIINTLVNYSLSICRITFYNAKFEVVCLATSLFVTLHLIEIQKIVDRGCWIMPVGQVKLVVKESDVFRVSSVDSLEFSCQSI